MYQDTQRAIEDIADSVSSRGVIQIAGAKVLDLFGRVSEFRSWAYAHGFNLYYNADLILYIIMSSEYRKLDYPF